VAAGVETEEELIGIEEENLTGRTRSPASNSARD
jgi:hypothetical protein